MFFHKIFIPDEHINVLDKDKEVYKIKTNAQKKLILHLVFLTFPLVGKELKSWEKIALRTPNLLLREMAMASLKHKKFHCQGGSVFASWSGKPYWKKIVQAIIALQTISDYLDNLCDRAGIESETGFRQLHLAFLDALCPGVNCKDYYSLYPYQEDGGYLNSLVHSCQEALSFLPSYLLVLELVMEMANLYCTLQITKHLNWKERENRLITWLKPHLANLDQQLFWWELAAATGSTLGIFALFALASQEKLNISQIEKITQAYFPWIGALHILLDYFIDQEEDRIGKDLNFIFYYSDKQKMVQRLEFIFKKALTLSYSLPNPSFHKTIVEGLMAMYLSDPKVASQNLDGVASYLLKVAGPDCGRLYWLCSFFRSIGLI